MIDVCCSEQLQINSLEGSEGLEGLIVEPIKWPMLCLNLFLSQPIFGWFATESGTI